MLNLLILTSLFLVGKSSTSKVDYTANQKMSFVGQCIVNIGYEAASFGTYWHPGPIFTVPMPSTLATSNIFNIEYAVILGQLETYSLSLLKIFVYRNQISENQLKFQVWTYETDLIKKFTIKYLVYTKDSIAQNFQMVLPVNYYGSSGIKISHDDAITFSTIISYPVNISNSFNIVSMISGINVAYNINNIYDVGISSSLLNSTHLKIMIQSKYTYELTVLYQLALTVFIIARQNPSKNYMFYHGKFSASSGATKIFNTTYKMSGINTLVGLNSFYLSYQPGISFFVAVNEQNGIQISTADSFSFSNILNFDYLIIESFYCDYKTPYFQQNGQLCYSQCPGRTVQNNTTLSCQCLINSRVTKNSVCLTQTQIGYSFPFKTALTIVAPLLTFIMLLLCCIIIYQRRLLKSSKKFHQNARPRILSSKVKVIQISETSQKLEGSKSKPFDFYKKRNQIQRFKQIFQFSESQISVQNHINYKYKSKKSVSSQKRVIWVPVSDPFKNQRCCHCQQQGAYALSYCEHRYTIQHLQKLIKEKKNCAKCAQLLQTQIKYICPKCCKRYRFLSVDELIDKEYSEKFCGCS